MISFGFADVHLSYLSTTDHIGDDVPFSELVVMQSTGLRDRSGVEIYEGDILDWNGIGRAVVEWSEGDATFLLDYPDGSLGGFDTRPTLNGLSSAKTPYYEVIGNRFEHPHLLLKEA